MNLRYALLYCLFLPVMLLQSGSQIDWSPGYKLTWNDFKERPDKSSPNAALTSTAIRIDFDYTQATLHFQLHCSFDKKKSWGLVKNDYILSHEQGHFDITEIYTRMLNRDLIAYRPRPPHIADDVNHIYEDNQATLKMTQAAYDQETQNSVDSVKQKEWKQKIAGQLSSLQQWAAYH